MTTPPRPPLSVLDLASVPQGATPAEALRRATDLAQRAEQWGFHRYWVAEHHNMPGIASSSPAVLLAHVGAHTGHIRIGSGGVMLPNHAPLVVAEQFGTLEALHPGRVDLGIGRAPGTDQFTAAALRPRGNPLSVEDFPQNLTDLLGFFDGPIVAQRVDGQITAVPGAGYRPEVWLLGSSSYSAQLAGLLGLPFAFASHFAPGELDAALERYRLLFRPSEALQEPRVLVTAPVLVADDEKQARYLAGSGLLSFVRLRTGRHGLLPSPEEAAGYTFTPSESSLVKHWSGIQVVGTADSVRDRLVELVRRTGADELMVTTMCHRHDDRLRSFELLAGTWFGDGPNLPEGE